MTSKENKEYQKARRQFLMINKRCANCSAKDERTLDGYTLCKRCATKQKERYALSKSQKKCPNCGVQDERILEGHIYCESCALKQRLLHKRGYYNEH
jgi:hypothetical protein